MYLAIKIENMATKEKLTIGEKIDRAKDSEGRTQVWIIARMVEKGFDKMTDTLFSRKKKGFEDFTEEELTTLSEILNTNLS